MARVQDDPRRLTAAYLRGTAIVVLVTLPAGVVAAILAPELVLVAFGAKWIGLVPVFQVLAMGMMFRTSFRLSDSLSRATGRVYRRAWRQVLFAVLVFLGALIGQRAGVTGVAVGVLAALFLNYVLMAQLALSVGQISWPRYLSCQLPAMRLTAVVGGITYAAISGMRYLGFPPVASLVVGTLAAVGSGALLIRQAPIFALGDDGAHMLGTLRGYVTARLRPARAGETGVSASAAATRRTATKAAPIAFFLPSLRGGGAERVMMNLALGITERGLPVDLVLAAAEGAFLSQLPPTIRLVDLRAGRVLPSLGPSPAIFVASGHGHWFPR